MSNYSRRDLQINDECGAPTRDAVALDFDPAPMSVDQLPGDRQSESAVCAFAA